jgi:hypothetical protein
MEVFESMNIDLGTVVAKSKVPVEFKLTRPLNIKGLSAGCYCTTPPSYDKERNVIKAVFTPSPIPHHLKRNKSYVSFKKIYVRSDEGDFTLEFRATVVEE